MSQTITDTNFEFPRQTNLYKGKVLIISNGRETKRITLNSQNLIEIKFN